MTILLLPPLVAAYADERYLPAAVTERLRNPKPVTKAFLALLGLYVGLRFTCDIDVVLQRVLSQKQGAGEEEL